MGGLFFARIMHLLCLHACTTSAIPKNTMSQQKKGGRKLSRTAKKAGYYDRQYGKTSANKARRAAKAKRRADYWAGEGKELAEANRNRLIDRRKAKLRAKIQRRINRQKELEATGAQPKAA